MRNALIFLELLTKQFPPLARHAHSLTLSRGKLMVSLVNTSPCSKFILSASELEHDPAKLVRDITGLMSKEDQKPTT
jgi:hypothetical protein